MVLEASVLILDNSSYAQNGDYNPTRYAAQADAVNMIFNAKTGSNPESVVGLMTCAGKRGPEVLVNLTQDSGKFASALHQLQHKLAGDHADIATAIQVAQLCLKHRSNKNQRQRIVLFIGSPLPADKADYSSQAMSKLGKKLKKNNVALDIISLGEVEENETMLQSLVEGANSSENSHLLTVAPTMSQLLSDAVLTSPILMDPDSGAGPSGAGASGSTGAAASGGDDLGVDPNLDPELAMALRMSLEDERARQAAAAAAEQAASGATSQPSAPSTSAQPSSAATTTPAVTSPLDSMTELAANSPINPPSSATETTALLADADMGADDEEDEELKAALALSRGDDVDMDDAAGDEDEDDEEEEIRKAIALSLQADQGASGGEKK